MAKLTKRTLDQIKPRPTADTFVWDGELRGFGVRMKPSGSASFIIQYRTNQGRTRRFAFAQLHTLTPEEARRRARQLLAEAEAGGDPSSQRKQERHAITIGRTQPPPKAVEDIAAALTGKAPQALAEWYPGGDALRKIRRPEGVTVVLGEADAHPDPFCERVRARIAEGEVMQALGRGRGVNRTAENPLVIFALNDVALPIPINGVVSDDLIFKPSPEELMLAEGGVAFEDGSAAALAYPGLWKSPEAARAAMHRKSSVTFPYKYPFIGECNAALRVRAATYQRQGNGQRKATVKFDMRIVTDPRLTLERMIGPLSFFELHPLPEEQNFGSATANIDAYREFCLQRMAELYLDAPIPLAAAESEREMLIAYRLWRSDANIETVKPAFRATWQEVAGDWDLGVMAAADKLWAQKYPERAAQRIQRAMALFDAHADLQICCPTELPRDEWLQAAGDSSYLIREFATDAIEQGWPVHRLFGKPSRSDDGGLIYFLKGERISEFSSGGIMTTSGRVFQRHPLHAHAA